MIHEPVSPSGDKRCRLWIGELPAVPELRGPVFKAEVPTALPALSGVMQAGLAYYVPGVNNYGLIGGTFTANPLSKILEVDVVSQAEGEVQEGFSCIK